MVETAANDPVDKKLWASVVSAAKRKFTVYPSAYANGWAVQEYKRRGGKWREKADLVPADWPGWESASKDEGLGKWFSERWVDISRTNSDGSHPACGRPTAGMSQADYAKAYPKCVPAARAARMSPAEKKNAVARKRDADNATGTGKGQKPTMVSTQKSRAGDPSATAKDKDPKGGLSAAGRKKFGVQKGVTNYSGAGEEDKKRWVRWALRFTKTPRPLKDDKGNPTRYALMFHAWGEPVPTSTGAVSAVHTKAVARAKQLKMGQYEKADLAEAADTFFFEHEWVPVADQPAEVATCELCGLNRYSDEHTATFVDYEGAEEMAAASLNKAPYKIQKRGSKFVVLNNGGEVKGTHPTKDAALAQLRALYASVPGAGKAADRKPWTGHQKRAVRAAEEAFNNVGHPVPPLTLADYADPGYMKDGKTRYLINQPERVRTAWAYIQQSGTARSYTPAERAKIMARIRSAAQRFKIDLDAEHAATVMRLAKDYGPKLDLVGGPVLLSDKPPVGPPTGPSPKEVEDDAIEENAESPAAQGPHPFMAAEFPGEDGTPRCRLCGQGADPHAEFEPKIPVAAAEGLTLLHPGVTYTTNGNLTSTAIAGPDGRTITMSTTAPATAVDRAPSTPVLSEGQALAAPESAKAFLTEVNGRTLLTAPANVFVTEVEQARLANQHFLWMQGRFVGAEKANRNGAFWSTEDLELGELSVQHGPLNWLHEARHVIGTIAKTQMVKRDEQTASDLDQPYIQAASAIWRWIYPDEAWVIEQASDSKKLWYSMECVSKEVACVGVAGCGARASYGEYLKGEGATCEHMRQRSATRHFSNPTFLGGAVIVPPVRPGWAEADASVMRQAAQLAEHAYEQAQPVDTSASEWEQLMAQIVRYGSAV